MFGTIFIYNILIIIFCNIIHTSKKIPIKTIKDAVFFCMFVWYVVWLNQNRYQTDVDSVFLYTSRCQDSMAYKSLIVNPRIQYIWHAFSQWKFPNVAIILIWQQNLCPNFLSPSNSGLSWRPTYQRCFHQNGAHSSNAFPRSQSSFSLVHPSTSPVISFL